MVLYRIAILQLYWGMVPVGITKLLILLLAGVCIVHVTTGTLIRSYIGHAQAQVPGLARMSSQVSSAESSHHGLARTSLNSDVARPVTVVNETVAPVQLYWVNYEGALPARCLMTLSHYHIIRIASILSRPAVSFSLHAADSHHIHSCCWCNVGMRFARAAMALGHIS